MAQVTTEQLTSKYGQETLPAFATNSGIGLAAGVKILAGTIVCQNAAGFAVPGSASPNLVVLGIAEKTIDNTGLPDGATIITPRMGVFPVQNSAGADLITQADAGKDCFLADNFTVAKTNGGGTRSRAGRVFGIDTQFGGVLVLFCHVTGNEAPANGNTPALTRKVRGVVTANQANLAAFAGVAGGGPIDGITYVAGDLVLLAGQTTVAQNGVYVVGTVAAGTAPLTRPSEWPAGSTIQNGSQAIVAEGTKWSGSTWRTFATGTVVVDANDPQFFPAVEKGSQALTAGAATVSNLFIRPNAVAQTTDTTAAAATRAVRTAGQGNGSLAITGTSTDTIDYLITNFG